MTAPDDIIIKLDAVASHNFSFQDGAGGHFGFDPLEKISQQCQSGMDLILIEDILKIQNLQKNFVKTQFHGYL